MKKNCTCQSCGMPIRDPGIRGTGADGMPIEDYCVYCFKDGGFTSDVTMDEMMRLCSNYVEGNNSNYYIANMRVLYPRLKRWAKKEDTQNEYYKSINKVLDHIRDNLHENADLKTLAEVACISPYHFHRIFKSVIGESLAEYVGRMRMEYVMGRLKAAGTGMAELAQRTGYSSEQALSRAFKKYFGLPPGVFKTTFFKTTFGNELVPRICKVASRNVVTLRGEPQGGETWRKLYLFAMVNRFISESTESVEVVREGVNYPALTVNEPLKSGEYAESLVLPEGTYAIFTHKGDISGLSALHSAALNYWLPKSRYRHGEGWPYVVYLNNPAMVPSQEMLSEIYVPVVARELSA